jgi:hypothetical protein
MPIRTAVSLHRMVIGWSMTPISSSALLARPSRRKSAIQAKERTSADTQSGKSTQINITPRVRAEDSVMQ